MSATPVIRPRRSVLYMPGANERAVEKAKGLAADAIIFDLEDATAPDAKVDARGRVCAAVASGEYGHRELTIRVNGLDTEWQCLDPWAADVTFAKSTDLLRAHLTRAAELAETHAWR